MPTPAWRFASSAPSHVAPGLLDRAPAVEWLVLDRADGFPAGATEGVLREVAGHPSWRMVREEAGIVLLRREP
ncbi:hypothetical protein AB0M64_07645 [Streptomyces sp. NPDC051771]|uniref:hypothetical protein n=1 Tax=Streptomyces sp. NPDC051771 TaxID=3154847 RepID=UPI00342E7263